MSWAHFAVDHSKKTELISNECQLSTESNVWSGSTNLKVSRLKMNINDKISLFAIYFALNQTGLPQTLKLMTCKNIEECIRFFSLKG